MLYMPPQLETIFTKCHIFTMHTFINSLTSSNFPQLTTITIIVILLPNFLVDLLLLQHILFFLDFSDNISRFFISAQWTFHYIIVLHLMFSPLTETFKMKSISADSMAGSSNITFDNLHMADST